MKEIAKRIWTEPSVAIGLLTSAILAILAVVDNADWDTQTIIGVIAPFAASLGIRQLVTPTVKVDEQLEVATRPGP